ncbi:tetratricopeptide repeat protein [Shewanella khirikhana]|uniref:tetratricopeptide repeat protein n=1 Tax=Shewanella khirikhana TaxID=1965282 RepID=UPI0030CA781B
MRLLSLVFFVLIFAFSPLASAKDLKSEEIQLRETPQQLFDRVSAALSLPKGPLASSEQLSFYAREQGLSPQELSELLALIARANLQPNVSNSNKRQDVDIIIQSLENTATTPYQRAMALMLKGRAMARLDQRFEDAASYFIQSLTVDQESQSLESQLLRLNLHEQLGTMYLLINQDVTALVHLQKFRDHAYQLRNDYLIASAEAELGKYYIKKQELTKALQHYSEALRLSDRENHPFQRAFFEMQLAKVYRDLGQSSDALAHAHEAAETYTRLGIDGYLSSTLTVIAVTHAGNNEWNKAIDYYLNAQQVDRRSGNFSALARNFHNLGEAYSKLDENDLALNYLEQANQMFVERKMKHYLVHNEVLLAEIHCKMSHWADCIIHADKALPLAEQQSLDDVKISALKQKIIAAKALEDLNAAIEHQSLIIELMDSPKAAEATVTGAASALTEQKLKLDLHQKVQQLENASDTLRERTILAAGAVMLALILATIVGHYRRSKLELKAQCQELAARLPQDPITGRDGYRALCTALEKGQVKALALLRVPNLCEADIQLGQQRMVDATLGALGAIETLPGIKAYPMRPGLIALALDGAIDAPDALLFNLRNQLTDLEGQLQLGFINLPLLPNPELSIPHGIHLEVLQMALAGIDSLAETNDIYLGFRALDFTPSAVFSQPLYLHLEKSIGRGLVRVETNGDKENLRWPLWKMPDYADKELPDVI